MVSSCIRNGQGQREEWLVQLFSLTSLILVPIFVAYACLCHACHTKVAGSTTLCPVGVLPVCSCPGTECTAIMWVYSCLGTVCTAIMCTVCQAKVEVLHSSIASLRSDAASPVVVSSCDCGESGSLWVLLSLCLNGGRIAHQSLTGEGVAH